MAQTSPRTTHLLHHRRDLSGLVHIRRVLHQATCLGGESGPLALALGGLGDCVTSRFGTSDAAAVCDLVERA
jgi:hypothetical protein